MPGHATGDLQERLRRKVAAQYAKSQPALREVTDLAERLLSHRLNEMHFARLDDPALSERSYDALVAGSKNYAALLMREGFEIEEVEEMLNRLIAIADIGFRQWECAD